MRGNRNKLKDAELNASDKEKEGRRVRQDILCWKLVQELETKSRVGRMQLKNAKSVPNVQPEGITVVEGLLVNG